MLSHSLSVGELTAIHLTKRRCCACNWKKNRWNLRKGKKVKDFLKLKIVK